MKVKDIILRALTTLQNLRYDADNIKAVDFLEQDLQPELDAIEKKLLNSLMQLLDVEEQSRQAAAAKALNMRLKAQAKKKKKQVGK